MIYSTQTFTNDDGISIVQRLPLDGGAAKFHCDCTFSIQYGPQTLQVQVRADIDAEDIRAAYENFPAARDKARATAMEAVQKQIAEAEHMAAQASRQVILPGAVPHHVNGALRGPPRLAN